MTGPGEGERLSLHEYACAEQAANAVFWLDAEWAQARWAHGDDALPTYDDGPTWDGDDEDAGDADYAE
jgi:hypothetical protein